MVVIPLALLLLVNIAWSIALHRRLSCLDSDGERLHEFLGEFDAAIARAREAVAGFRQEVGDLVAELRRQTEGARLRSEQLGRLCEGAERLGRRLELAIERAARARADVETPYPTAPDAVVDERVTGAAPAARPTRTAGPTGRERGTAREAGSRTLPRELEALLARLR